MKYIFITILLFFSCSKNNLKSEISGNCVNAVVVKTTVNCNKVTTWGIKLNSGTLPQDLIDSIPSEFQQEGLKVCVKYDTAIYPFTCICCDNGPFAKIKSIRKAE